MTESDNTNSSTQNSIDCDTWNVYKVFLGESLNHRAPDTEEHLIAAPTRDMAIQQAYRLSENEPPIAGPAFTRDGRDLDECDNWPEVKSSGTATSDGGPPEDDVRTDGGSRRPRDASRRVAQSLETILQETRMDILQVILGHPQNAPSLAEIDYYIPSKSKSTLSEHLDVLVDEDVVTRLQASDDQRATPSTFYALSVDGWRALNRHALLIDELDAIQAEIENTETTDQVQRYENAPRPDLSPVDECYVRNTSQ